MPPKIVLDPEQVTALRNGLNSDANRKLLEAMTCSLRDPKVDLQITNEILNRFNTLLVNEEVYEICSNKKEKREGREMV